MPYPTKGESQSDYVSRAVKEFMAEGYKQKEALGRAYGFYRTYKNKKVKPTKKGE